MTQTEEEKYAALLKKENITIRDFDIDAFADGVIAHRTGKGFHENPDGQALTLKRLSWSMGWNERALQNRS